ncbi:hypothetical protein DTO166G4_5147 [Paecilomyces variotii]|nr:hypothetical protein DTO166G4_5147 [Paecilomyces variotii]KAJ9229169.1 hypothetical protein DTO169E5_8947 [Paecilomyces variotii]KAJ9229352.1 hypothetical protein DTO166G5_7934 [Paecilomyces variotii]KAJ9251101.1 hypothetical protein DTO207G8_5654 [Paecilomyces variotii]KAJ9320613.1 hypothetical protein DTO027B3_8346 [Paecilomyces variotii]
MLDAVRHWNLVSSLTLVRRRPGRSGPSDGAATCAFWTAGCLCACIGRMQVKFVCRVLGGLDALLVSRFSGIDCMAMQIAAVFWAMGWTLETGK